MRLESENFIVRKMEESDKENVYLLEISRPWMKYLHDFKDELENATGKKADIFEELFESYINSNTYWVIERKPNTYIGSVTIDKDGKYEAFLYIQVLDDANVDGFGKELFDNVIDNIAHDFLITTFYVDLWNEADRSKQIYQEAGYKMKNGHLEIDM